VYLGVGSNIQPQENLPRAINLISEEVTIEKISSVYQTQAVGSHGPDFLNAVVLVRTTLSWEQLKNTVIREIEDTLGRIRTSDKNAPRTIDIDILIKDDEVYDEDIWEQAHLAIPLAELYPDYTHPITNKTLSHIAEYLSKSNPIIKRRISLPRSPKISRVDI
jgi:2-amino-4-hydroxy-6-hydroxymethyldihydropteridine diphosphokinase